MTTYVGSETSIDAITASGNSQATAAPIERLCEITVVVVTIPDPSDICVSLPPSAPIGDVVEVYNPNSTSITVFTASGDTVFGQPGDSTIPPMVVLTQTSGRFRKIGLSDWGR
jgi:hypothetical protein